MTDLPNTPASPPLNDCLTARLTRPRVALRLAPLLACRPPAASGQGDLQRPQARRNRLHGGRTRRPGQVQTSAGNALSGQGFNEGKGKPFTAEDVRYTVSKDGKTLYAIVCGLPSGPVALKSLGKAAALLKRPISKVEQLGATEALVWALGTDALTVTAASAKPASDAAIVFKITLK